MLGGNARVDGGCHCMPTRGRRTLAPARARVAVRARPAHCRTPPSARARTPSRPLAPTYTRAQAEAHPPTHREALGGQVVGLDAGGLADPGLALRGGGAGRGGAGLRACSRHLRRLSHPISLAALAWGGNAMPSAVPGVENGVNKSLVWKAMQHACGGWVGRGGCGWVPWGVWWCGGGVAQQSKSMLSCASGAAGCTLHLGLQPPPPPPAPKNKLKYPPCTGRRRRRPSQHPARCGKSGGTPHPCKTGISRSCAGQGGGGGGGWNRREVAAVTCLCGSAGMQTAWRASSQKRIPAGRDCIALKGEVRTGRRRARRPRPAPHLHVFSLRPGAPVAATVATSATRTSSRASFIELISGCAWWEDYNLC